MVLLKINDNSQLELKDIDEFDIDRDLQAEFNIEETGKYILLPINSGCSLIQGNEDQNAKEDRIP